MRSTENSQPDLFLRNLLLFSRALRSSGLVVTTAQILTLVEACSFIDFKEREDVRSLLRATLIQRHSDIKVFNALFDLFWQAVSSSKESLELGQLIQRTRSDAVEGPENESVGAGEDTEMEELLPVWRRYSAVERLRYTDFAELTDQELKEVEAFLKDLRWSSPLRLTRRSAKAVHGGKIDMRRTWRTSLKSGGFPLKISLKTRKRKLRPVVLLCDISGSMESYARILLQFAFVLGRGLPKVEAFVFSTRLTRITYSLGHRDMNLAIQRLTNSLTDWGSGTRIGAALKAFNFKWGRRVSTKSPIVMIVSDGWDRGDVELLGREMGRLHRSCYRLIWLNPLLGSPGYRPLTKGICAALPHVDHFLPVHNLASLEQLKSVLEDLSSLEHSDLKKTHWIPRMELEGVPDSAF